MDVEDNMEDSTDEDMLQIVESDIETELDKQLKDKSSKFNLSAINVKSIIHVCTSVFVCTFVFVGYMK